MKVIRKIVLPLAMLVFVVNIFYVWHSDAMQRSVMGIDEYFFYRVTTNLPNYETDGLWFCEEGAPDKMSLEQYEKGRYSKAYTTPIWVHPLVANYVAYPIAMLFDDVPEQIQWLRLVDMAIIILTVGLFADIIRRHTTPYVAALCVAPMLVGRLLLASGIMFYNDLFMWLFFAVTMWVIAVRPRSKWVIALAALTTLCKLDAPLLLLPILLYLHYQAGEKAIVARVGAISVAVFVGYLAFQAIVAGDALYVIKHWMALNPTAKNNIIINVLPNLWSYVISWGLWVSLPLLLAGTVLIIKRKIKAFYGFAAFGVVVLLCGFGWGCYAYHVYPVMYASMFMVPVIWFRSGIKDVAEV